MKTIESKKNFVGLLLALVLLAAALLFYKDSLNDILQGIKALSWEDILVCSLLGVLFYILEGTGISMIQFILKKISVMIWGVLGFVALLALGGVAALIMRKS